MNFSNLHKDFPILKRKINGKPLVYFDNAASSLRPKIVLDAINNYYTKHSANIHRGIHTLSQEATEQFEETRDVVQKFIGASHRAEIIFTSGATESINLVASSFGNAFLRRGDEIVVTEAEHHSNFVPWQQLAKKRRLKIKFIPLKLDGTLDLINYKKLLNKKTRLVAITHASNVLGIINPIKKIVNLAKKYKAVTLVDAAQSIPHIPVNVKNIGCDFFAFSGHKMLGPTGVGVLYGKKELLSQMPPYKTGGHMIEKVTKEETSFAAVPQKFEAGTMPIAQVIGLGAAIKYLQNIGYKNIALTEQKLVKHALGALQTVPGLKIVGSSTPKNRLAVFSFSLAGIPPHDIASLLDETGIAVRAGHNCTQILHRKFGLNSSVRASLYFYNTTKEIDKMTEALKKIKKIFQK